MYKFRIDFTLEFDNDGEKMPCYDIVFANSPEAAIESRRRLYSDPNVVFELVSIFEA